MAPLKPSCRARSGLTTPMPTVRCFQIRLSVSSVWYSSSIHREAIGEILEEVQQAAVARLVELLDRLRILEAVLLVLRHLVGQVAIDATWPVVGAVHANAGDRLEHVEQVLALAEGVEHHGHGADIQRMGADVEQVVLDPRHLVHHDSDVLGTDRHLDT
jgi:hypothetical protein